MNPRPDGGATLLEVVVCLMVLGLVLAAFGDNVQRAIAAETFLSERVGAQELMSEIRAMLSAEDPFAGPTFRTYALADGTTGRATAHDICEAPVIAPDNAAQPAACGNGGSPVRRWTITVRFASTTADTERDSLRSVLDVAAPTAASGWTTAGVAR